MSPESSAADAIGKNDDNVLSQRAVYYPQSEAGGEQQEHVERDVVSLTYSPSLFELRQVGCCCADRCGEANHRNKSARGILRDPRLFGLLPRILLSFFIHIGAHQLAGEIIAKAPFLF
jgi:hypothetical protein